VKRATVVSLRMRTPLYSPPFSIIWAKIERSAAVLNRPA